MFHKRLDSAASNPAFLPNLAIIIELPEHTSLHSLCNKHPIIYYYHPVEPYMYAEIYPNFEDHGSGLDLMHNLSAHDVGVLIQESEWTSPNVCSVPGVSILMRFPKEVKSGSQSPVQDPLSWAGSMLSVSKTPFDEFHFLEVSFESKPPFQSTSAQPAAVEELCEYFPELEEVSISYPELEWSRRVDHPIYSSKYFPKDPLPEWTPNPCENFMPYWMDWWLQALGLNYPKAHNSEDIAQITDKLLDGMSLRWGSDFNNLLSANVVVAYFVSHRPEANVNPE